MKLKNNLLEYEVPKLVSFKSSECSIFTVGLLFTVDVAKLRDNIQREGREEEGKRFSFSLTVFLDYLRIYKP